MNRNDWKFYISHGLAILIVFGTNRLEGFDFAVLASLSLILGGELNRD